MATKGGKRPGAGRKPVAVEEDVRAAIRRAIEDSPEAINKIWKSILEKAEKGSDKHAQLLFNYYYGKPKENEGAPSEMIITVNRVRS